MRQVITKSGLIIPLAEWQKLQGFTTKYEVPKLSKFFSTKERSFNKGNWLLHELLFEISDRLREKVGKPVYANSAYRTQLEQMKLRKTNKNAALISPHTYGMAIDYETSSDVETDLYVKYLKTIAIELGIKIRIGYKQYKLSRQTFVHCDVCPEMFGVGKPWEMLPVPDLFRESIEW